MRRRKLHVFILMVLATFGDFSFSEEKKPEKENAPLKRLMVKTKKERLADMSFAVADIASLKKDLRKGMIDDDKKVIDDATKSIAQRQSELKLLITAPVGSDVLDMASLGSGQAGKIPDLGFKILQINDKSIGKALVYHPIDAEIPTFRVIGTDLDDLIDDSKFAPSAAFLVLGTTTYNAVSGGKKTVFELQQIPELFLFAETELKDIRFVANEECKIILTPDEQAQAKLAIEKHAIAEKMAQESAAKKEFDAKSRRALSFLDSGKLLLKNGNPSGAKKQFEKAIAEAPESSAAKEAKKLLETLP